MEKIGIIAGRGNFPLLLAREARSAGYGTMAIAVRGSTRRALKKCVDKLSWIGVTEFSLIIDMFKKENIRKVAMAGQINPYSLFNPKVMSNPEVQDFFGRIDDRRADTIFKAFAGRLQDGGLELLDSTLFLSKYLPADGVLSKRKPSSAEYGDIDFGFRLASHLGSMDIGQSVCVKNGVILAVESIEGTDNAVRRAASLVNPAPYCCGTSSGIVLVKVSKPSQDMRFDVPVVGLNTVKHLPKNSCLAIQAGKTLFLNQNEAICLADKKSIAVVAKGLPKL